MKKLLLLLLVATVVSCSTDEQPAKNTNNIDCSCYKVVAVIESQGNYYVHLVGACVDPNSVPVIWDYPVNTKPTMGQIICK